MPRRHRPPLTSREIGAYTAGARLAKLYTNNGYVHRPDDLLILHDLADEDAAIVVSLGAKRFWYWFDRGWSEYIGRMLL